MNVVPNLRISNLAEKKKHRRPFKCTSTYIFTHLKKKRQRKKERDSETLRYK